MSGIWRAVRAGEQLRRPRFGPTAGSDMTSTSSTSRRRPAPGAAPLARARWMWARARGSAAQAPGAGWTGKRGCEAPGTTPAPSVGGWRGGARRRAAMRGRQQGAPAAAQARGTRHSLGRPPQQGQPTSRTGIHSTKHRGTEAGTARSTEAQRAHNDDQHPLGHHHNVECLAPADQRRQQPGKEEAKAWGRGEQAAGGGGSRWERGGRRSQRAALATRPPRCVHACMQPAIQPAHVPV